MLRIGIIGLSVHSEAFTEIINSDHGNRDFEESQVVALYEPPVNKDVEFSEQQIIDFRLTIAKHNVEVVDSMNALLDKSDAVMVLSNDGRVHFEQTLPVLKAGKPVYIDKPLAANFEGVKSIYNASTKWKVPVFSSSALRYGDGFQSDVGSGKIGQVLGGETYGPAPLQADHVDLFWDGIHGVELLYTIMGMGCQSVQQWRKGDVDVILGTWNNNRMGLFRGIRKGKTGFGGRAFGTDKIAHMNKFGGYGPLVVEIVKFFQSGISPVTNEETIEIYAFMEAARRSIELNGQRIYLNDILNQECEECNYRRRHSQN